MEGAAQLIDQVPNDDFYVEKCLEEIRSLQDDIADIALAAAPRLTDNGQRYSLDEVLERFGYTREQLADDSD
jgi:hypothetical protein